MSPNYLRSLLSTPTENGEAERDPLFVQSIARAMEVLSIFHQVDRPLSLQEIASMTGLGRSNVQRIVFTLRSLGYITRDPDDRGYVPGLRLLDHSLDFLRLNPVVVKATPILLELRRAVRERVDLSIWDDLRLVYASRLQSKREILTSTFLGYSVPVFCVSGGWAILSQLDEDEVSDIIERSHRAPLTPLTITDPDLLKDKIRETRENGYALALEQILPGEIAIGAAILDQAQRPVAAIHVAGSLAEWTPEEFTRQFAPLLIQAARTISRG
ncbi:transcriptional regulator, IclR family [Roseibium suaedae]|uniref:Transcriptional regulator, IclR family n=1 Tax=Roseibium suaedae TaxID=735517 RepID=A0A1M7KPH6_9HYPH|nr:transcriptional regulator, IclR family [Roseibium suaedae]